MKKIVFFIFVILFSSSVFATDYYVDFANGNDGDAGTSEETAWKTLDNVYGNNLNLLPGDSVNFKRGTTFYQKGNFKDVIYIANEQGNITHPVNIQAYGLNTDPKPIIDERVNITGSFNNLGSNIWNITLSQNPLLIWLNETVYPRVTNYNEITSEFRISYNDTSKSLYVYAESDPATYYNTIKSMADARSWSLYLLNAEYINIKNITFIGGYNAGIELRNASYINIENCNITGVRNGFLTTKSSDGPSHNIYIHNNIFEGYPLNNSLAISDSTFDGLKFVDAGHDSLIYENNFINWHHTSLQLNADDAGEIIGVSNISVFDNNFTGIGISYGRALGFSGYYGKLNNIKVYGNIMDSQPVRNQLGGSIVHFYNNIIINSTKSQRKSTSHTGEAINIELFATDMEANNILIENNTIIGADDACIMFEDSGSGTNITNVTIRNNILINCNRNATDELYYNASIIYEDSIRIFGNNISNNLFYQENANKALINYRGSYYNITGLNSITGNSDNFSNNVLRNLYLASNYSSPLYSNVCFLSVIGNYVGAYPCYLSQPYNQIFTNASSSVAYTNVDNTSINLPGLRVLSFEYPTILQPIFSSIATTIDDVNYTYSTSELNVSCDGTGNIGLLNMVYISGDRGFYDVYHDGVFVESVDTNTYTITSCSTWSFRPTSSVVSSIELSQSLNPFFSAFAVIMTGILVACGFALVKAFESGDSGMMIVVSTMAIAVTIIILIGIYILGQVSTIVP